MEKYETIQAILEEAGLYHREKIELNDIDSQIILLDDRIFADTNYDDVIDKDDIVVLVDGIPAEILEVDIKSSMITLDKKVSSGQIVKVKYAYSPIEQEFVEKVRDEAITEIMAKNPCQSVFNDKYKPVLRYIVRLLSAGKLLIRDYGFNEDIDGTSKDGYKKIELASQKLDELIASICSSENSCSSSGFVEQDDGDLFPMKNRPSSKEW